MMPEYIDSQLTFENIIPLPGGDDENMDDDWDDEDDEDLDDLLQDRDDLHEIELEDEEEIDPDDDDHLPDDDF